MFSWWQATVSRETCENMMGSNNKKADISIYFTRKLFYVIFHAIKHVTYKENMNP
jgi:hypothetical protein